MEPFGPAGGSGGHSTEGGGSWVQKKEPKVDFKFFLFLKQKSNAEATLQSNSKEWGEDGYHNNGW